MAWLTLDFNLFIPMVMMAFLYLIFIRSDIKYQDVRLIIVALFILNISTFFGFVKINGLEGAGEFFQYGLIAVAAWMIALDTYQLHKTGGEAK